MIRTARLVLQPWSERLREGFAALHADPEVMADQGGPISPAASDAKFDRYRAAFERDGVSRWAVEGGWGQFVGYVGVMFRPEMDHPLGSHYEIGWRLARSAWGLGYATEAARSALDHAVGVLGDQEIVSYTSETNQRSRAVMDRLGLKREPTRDFSIEDGRMGSWRGLVWTASAGQV